MTYYEILDWSAASFNRARTALNLSRKEVAQIMGIPVGDLMLVESMDIYLPIKRPLYRLYNEILIERQVPMRFMSDYGILKSTGSI